MTTDTNHIEALRDIDRALALADKSNKIDRKRVVGMAVIKHIAAIRTALSARASAGEGVSPLMLAVIGRKHFGNPIPQEWYAAARELLNAAPQPATGMTDCRVPHSKYDPCHNCEPDDTSQPAAPQPQEAPWPDFEGNPIHDRDRIRHPYDGMIGVVVHMPEFADNPSDAWRIVYQDVDNLIISRLCLQIGHAGQGVVVK